MKAIISFITALFALISAFFSGNVIPEEKVDEFVPVLRFMACSDTHINGAADEKRQRITDAINFCYDVAENDAYYNKLDAVMFAGDVTDNGTDEQFAAFGETVTAAVKGDTKILAIVAKNHDSYISCGKSTSFISELTGNGSDYHVVIGGYHFIGISTSPSDNSTYDVSQRIWLEKQLREAANEDPDKPIFVEHHEHITNTVYGSSSFEGWGKTYFKDIIARYPQVVDFSGHSHYPLNDPRSIWQGTFTAVGTSSMFYMEFTVDDDRTVHPQDCDKGAQAWLVEVDANNRVRLRGFDVINSAWLCDYLVTDPGNPATYTYTTKNREKLASAPQFEEGAALSSLYVDGSCTVTAPAAVSTDGNPIFVYRVNVYNKNGVKVYSEYLINNYWTVNTYEEVSFTVPCEIGNTITVTAENSYGMQSDALSCPVG